jgi:hypothetical protein
VGAKSSLIATVVCLVYVSQEMKLLLASVIYCSVLAINAQQHDTVCYGELPENKERFEKISKSE